MAEATEGDTEHTPSRRRALEGSLAALIVCVPRHAHAMGGRGGGGVHVHHMSMPKIPHGATAAVPGAHASSPPHASLVHEIVSGTGNREVLKKVGRMSPRGPRLENGKWKLRPVRSKERVPPEPESTGRNKTST